MKQLKKLGYVTILFVVIFFLHPNIAPASGSRTLSFPGDGYIGVCLHTQIPCELQDIFFAITGQNQINHCWVTATVNGVPGVIHSDGLNGVHFLCWQDLLDLCQQKSIRLFKPNKQAIGYAELKALGINLSDFPPIFRKLLARHLGHLMISTWIQEMLAYRGVSYDTEFMPSDEKIYCTELMGHGWKNTGTVFNLFPPKKAGTLAGWSSVESLLAILGFDITEDTDVYDITYILSDEIRPYFREIRAH